MNREKTIKETHTSRKYSDIRSSFYGGTDSHAIEEIGMVSLSNRSTSSLYDSGKKTKLKNSSPGSDRSGKLAFWKRKGVLGKFSGFSSSSSINKLGKGKWNASKIIEFVTHVRHVLSAGKYYSIIPRDSQTSCSINLTDFLNSKTCFLLNFKRVPALIAESINRESARERIGLLGTDVVQSGTILPFILSMLVSYSLSAVPVDNLKICYYCREIYGLNKYWFRMCIMEKSDCA